MYFTARMFKLFDSYRNFLKVPKLEYSPNVSIEATAKHHRRDEIVIPSSTPSLSNSMTSNAREYPLQNIRGKSNEYVN